MDQQLVLRSQLDDLRQGAITSLLRSPCSADWLRFATVHAIKESADGIVEGAPLQDLRRFKPHQVTSLAKRFFLARDVETLTALRALWKEFGASDDCCSRVFAALRDFADEWPTGVSRAAESLAFSPALANFLDQLRIPCVSACPLCSAIRDSHLIADDWPGGFPVVMKGETSPNISKSVWVPLVSRSSGRTASSYWREVRRSARNALCGSKQKLNVPGAYWIQSPQGLSWWKR